MNAMQCQNKIDTFDYKMEANENLQVLAVDEQPDENVLDDIANRCMQ